jgi:hypothetical protein
MMRFGYLMMKRRCVYWSLPELLAQLDRIGESPDVSSHVQQAITEAARRLREPPPDLLQINKRFWPTEKAYELAKHGKHF